MVGCVVGDDTLVSQSDGWYYWPDTARGRITSSDFHELYIDGATGPDYPGLTPINTGTALAFSSLYLDTMTDWKVFPELTWPDFEGRRHIPMGVQVRQKSYSLNEPPYKNIVLLDYTVTNIGEDTLRDLFLGYKFDADVVCRTGDATAWDDDLIGSLRDISTAYVIDNDGDPLDGYFQYGFSPTDGLGIRPVKVCPEVTDTNFNWLVQTWDSGEDYGPRLRGTETDPFYHFAGGGTGSPCGDAERFYVLSHDEWDYDQVRLLGNQPDWDVWDYPEVAIHHHFGAGSDIAGYISTGGMDLLPDSSARFVWAIFGAEMVHVDPDNGRNLFEGRIEEYMSNLHFGLLRETAEDAVAMVDEILDPMASSPTGLRLMDLSGSVASFRWDPWVFPEVIGYRMGFTRLPRSADQVGRPLASFQVDIHHTGCKETIDNLIPGENYVVTLSNISKTGVGQSSEPIMVGGLNSRLELPALTVKRDYTYVSADQPTALLNWYPPERDDVLYYKIYRSFDSVTADNRYRPYMALACDTIPYDPAFCLSIHDFDLCYYDMPAYDSTYDGLIPQYIDTAAQAGAYYWVTAVVEPGYESVPSRPVKCEQLPNARKDVLVIGGAVSVPSDYAVQDSIVAFYDRVLADYDHDFFFWFDSSMSVDSCLNGECFDWHDLADYELVIVNEFARTRVLGRDAAPARDILTRVVNAGKNLAFFGTPAGIESVGPSFHLNSLAYPEELFESFYLGIDSSTLRAWQPCYGTQYAVDSLAGFNRALPVLTDWPVVEYDTTRDCFKRMIKVLFDADSCLPLTPAFFLDNETSAIYEYNSAYPETSELHGLPCGIVKQHDHSLTYSFSFHLWAMEEKGARDLVARLLNKPVVTPPLELPRHDIFAQNFPNPFNSKTSIRFLLDKKSRVTVDVFNVLGQRVSTLLDDELLRGRRYHEVYWDGTDRSGNEVATGVYLYRITTDRTTTTKKMVLLK